MVALWAFSFATDNDQRWDDYKKFARSVELLFLAFQVFLLVTHAMVLAIALGHPVPVGPVARASLGLLAFGVGNVLPRIRANSLIGIRTHASLANDVARARTQRVAGYLLCVSGAFLVTSAFVASHVLSVISVAAFVVAILGSSIYSQLSGI